MTSLLWYMVYSQILLNFLLGDCHFGYIKKYFEIIIFFKITAPKPLSKTYYKGVDLTIKVNWPTQSLEPQLPIWI